jgi:hypothetical protein
MFNKERLGDIIDNFIYLPDTSKKDEKIVYRYPQYYAAKKLYTNIKAHQRPGGDGKGGTYFGATGCGKSFTMLFLSRLLMKSSPTRECKTFEDENLTYRSKDLRQSRSRPTQIQFKTKPDLLIEIGFNKVVPAGLEPATL